MLHILVIIEKLVTKLILKNISRVSWCIGKMCSDGFDLLEQILESQLNNFSNKIYTKEKCINLI